MPLVQKTKLTLIISSAFFTLALILTCACSGSRAQNDAKDKVVYAATDIQEGSTIKSTDLEEKEILETKIPIGAINDAKLAVGHVSKFGIEMGNIIQVTDLTSESPTSNIHIRLDMDVFSKLQVAAKSKGKSPSALATEWVMEKLKPASK